MGHILSATSTMGSVERSLPPLSLYVHLPWCVRKCPYCDFNSHQARAADIPQTAYINTLISELRSCIKAVEARPLHSIFFGGGTPSLFSPDSIERLLQQVQYELDWAPDIEITLEANPGALDTRHLRGYAQAGVNRLSLGVQSFHAEHLKVLGRVHTVEQARRALEEIPAAGFTRFNIDLMHGLPQQTPAQALEDIAIALSYQPDHLSWYQLTIEPNTHFYSRPPELPSENHLAQMGQRGAALIAQGSLEQYEVSAYARAGFESRHNSNYWQFGDYLGLGAGAHSKLSSFDQQHQFQVVRSQTTRAPKDYLNASSALKLRRQHKVSPEQLAPEFFMNALRMNKGFNPHVFEQRTALSFEPWRAVFDTLKARGLVTHNAHQISCTPLGRQYLDTVLLEFYEA